MSHRKIGEVLSRPLLTRSALVLCASLLAIGCDYERYIFAIGSYYVEGIAISHWTDVQQYGSTVRLGPGARFAIRSEEMTQFLAQYEIVIRSGDGFTIYTRTVPHRFDTANGIAFRYAIDGSWLRDANGTVTSIPFNADTVAQTIKLLSEADVVKISVGCENVYEGTTSLPATEYVIFETLPNTELEFRSIAYFEMEELWTVRGGIP